MIRIFLLAVLFLAQSVAANDTAGDYLPAETAQRIIDATLRITLTPSTEQLTPAERLAADDLLQAGELIHTLYLQQIHPEALAARSALQDRHAEDGESAHTANLLELFYLSKGPLATTLENKRATLVPVAPEQPGKAIFPSDLDRQELDTYLAANPRQKDQLLAPRTVVRRATSDNLDADLARLDRHPAVDALHPGLRQQLQAQAIGRANLYAVPYALAYAGTLRQISALLNRAASRLDDEAPDFSAYLRNRARDLLTGDYESGDASWVTGRFAGLNLQLGSYETYEDKLTGSKAFYSASLLLRNEQKTRELNAALTDLQAIEDALPYEARKRVRSDIPVGVYDVYADFGQARGSNTATILPNDADHSRKYGRTILLRYNIMKNAAIFDRRKAHFDAVVGADGRDALTSEGGFNRTLWHEIGHYLGVSKTVDGRDLDIALAAHSDLLEEMKSDLVSLFAARHLVDSGYYDASGRRAHYADGIRRTLQTIQPRPEQPYQNMQLMQFNYFLERGLIEAGADGGQLQIHFEQYHDVVADLLREVLAVQRAGDETEAAAFIDRWNYWDERLHGRLANSMRSASPFRRTLVRYAALEDAPK